MSKTRAEIRIKIVDRLYSGYEIVRSTATGGGTNYITDTALIQGMFEENDYVGAYVYISGGSGAPQYESNQIIAFDRAAGTLTVLYVWTGASSVANNDTYEIHYDLHPERVNEALNWAIGVGTNEALALTADDDTGTTTLEPDVIVEGALAYCKRAIANQSSERDPAPIKTEEDKLMFLQEAIEHENNWIEGMRMCGFEPWVADESLFEVATE